MAEGSRQGGRRRNGGSVLRVSPYLDPVALIGITLSIVGSVLVDLTNAATGVESFLACLMGITIALVLDSTVRAERRFRIRGMIEATSWLSEVLAPLAASTARIERRYAGTPIAAEARARYARLAEQLDELGHGRILRPRGDYEHLLASTHTCGNTLYAVTNVLAERPGRGLDWWTGGIGRHYWQANREALDRGVRLKRIFLYTTMTAELEELAAEQEEAGVHNLAIWDGTSAWEARLNAGGEIVGNIFTINEADLARLSQIFQACLRAARPRNQAPATPR